MPAQKRNAQTLLGRMEKGRAKPIFVGLVRPDPEDPNCVQYSSTPDGSKWLKIPASRIEAIDFLQDVDVNGNSYSLARVQMTPVRQTAAPLFKELAEHHSLVPLPTTLSAMMTAPPGGPITAAPPSPAPQKCGYVWTGSGYRYVCF